MGIGSCIVIVVIHSLERQPKLNLGFMGFGNRLVFAIVRHSIMGYSTITNTMVEPIVGIILVATLMGHRLMARLVKLKFIFSKWSIQCLIFQRFRFIKLG